MATRRPPCTRRFLRVSRLRKTVERHRDAGTLELRRHLHAEDLEQLDALLVGQQMAAAWSGVQVGAKVRGPAQERLRGLRAWIERIHLASQRPEFCKGDVAGPALR